PQNPKTPDFYLLNKFNKITLHDCENDCIGCINVNFHPFVGSSCLETALNGKWSAAVGTEIHLSCCSVGAVK
ncbi:MAG: hypothetical protein ACKO96_32220, partial [Flammeovirgaceae bacterium]